MKKIYKRVFCAMLITAFITLAPSKAFCIDINYDVSKLQDLVQQLQDAGNNVVGNAGIEIRQSIDELSSQIAQRIDQVHAAGTDLINQASAAIENIINDLMGKVQGLLTEVNNMIKGAIQCISAELAQRISQINDAITDGLNHLDETLKQTIDQVYVRASQLITTGTSSIAITVNSTFLVIAKVILVIFIFILLFWLIRNLWLGKFPKNKVLRFGIPSLLIVLAGGFAFLLFSPTALPRIIGSKTSLPIGTNTCNQADSLYQGFIASYNANGEKTSAPLLSLGNKTIEQLGLCQYSSTSAAEITSAEEKITGISALLFPPPSTAPVNVTTPDAACGTTPSVPPGILSKYNYAKLLALEKMKVKKQITGNNIHIVDTSTYRIQAERFTNLKIISVPVQNKFEPIKVEKLNPKVAKMLNKAG